jgi:RecA-family ATPase
MTTDTNTKPNTVPTQLPRLDLAAAFVELPPPLDYVLPGLPTRTVASIVSPGATGKSMLALEMAVSVAGGRDFLGLGITTFGRVLVIAAEDPAQILLQRIYAVGAHLTPEERVEVVKKISLCPMLASGINLRNSEWVDLIATAGADYRLIIIDTLSRVHDGDENERRDAAPIMRNLELIATRTGAAVIFLHHVSKSTALGGQSDAQQASRGSSVWVDEARWVGFLKTMDEKEAKKHGVSQECRKKYIRFGVSKQNYGVPVADLWLQRAEGGLLVPADFSVTSGSKSTIRPGAPAASLKDVEVCDDVPF